MIDQTSNKLIRILLLSLAAVFFPLQTVGESPRSEQIRNGWKDISAPLLMEYVRELCAEKYAGRLSGTKGYDDAAAWLAERLAKWQLKPGGDSGTYFQDFPNPYTLVLPGSELSLHLAGKEGEAKTRSYEIEKDFFPGSTSGSGEVTAEVVYVGFGISAPELNFDEYLGLDVRGKIVLVEVEVPVDPDRNAAEFAKWRPYSFHQYKVRNARDHGAAGMLYHYPIANPNCLYIRDLILTYIGANVVRDIFQGSGRIHPHVVKGIRKTLRERSFATGKIMTLKNFSEHHADGVGKNVIAVLPGSDPRLKNETIIIGAHLDHLGLNPLLTPGANDNASGVAVVMAVAQALAAMEPPPRRTVAFIFFAAEEQGVRGSEFYLLHPPPALANVRAFINLDGVGRGRTLEALAAKNYPDLWKVFSAANRQLVHAAVIPAYFHNRARPRLDAAHFMWADIPTVSFAATGAPEPPFPVYHTSHDRPEILTPEIMVDLGRLIFSAMTELADGK